MQQFEVGTLPREAELGTALNFGDAVEPARHLVELHLRLTPGALQDFPADRLDQIRKSALGNYNLFDQILTFSSEQENPHAACQNLIQKITQAYPQAFNVLHPLIAYSLHRSADFQRLDREARATLQGVQDRAEGLEEGARR